MPRFFIRGFLINCLLLMLLSCNQSACNQSAGKSGTKSGDGASAAVEGKDYFLLKRFRITDQSGLSEPVEAISFLLPANWKVDAGINWNLSRCLSDIVQFSLHGVSPDQQYELTILPTTQFDWVNNEQMMYALRNGGYGSGCSIAEPLDAKAYIQQVMPNLVGASSATASSISSIENQLKQQAAQYSASGMTFVPSVAEGRMSYADGSEGIALCSISQIIQSMQGYDGSMISHYQTSVNTRLVLKYPHGEEETARKILGTIQSSLRVNKVWALAIQTMFNNIRKAVQDETWKRIQITQQMQQEIGNNITRSWEKQNENTDKSSEWFSQYIRGVDSWTGEDGTRVELTSGYSNAWQKADGSYLLSNDPSFDPNVTFQESWSRLNK